MTSKVDLFGSKVKPKVSKGFPFHLLKLLSHCGHTKWVNSQSALLSLRWTFSVNRSISEFANFDIYQSPKSQICKIIEQMEQMYTGSTKQIASKLAELNSLKVDSSLSEYMQANGNAKMLNLKFQRSSDSNIQTDSFFTSQKQYWPCFMKFSISTRNQYKYPIPILEYSKSLFEYANTLKLMDALNITQSLTFGLFSVNQSINHLFFKKCYNPFWFIPLQFWIIRYGFWSKKCV